MLSKIKSIFLTAAMIGVAAGCVSSPMRSGPVSVEGSSPITLPHDVYHTVGPSETLWRISKTYNVEMNAVMRANRLTDPAKIKNGQRLLIPNTRGPRPMIPLFPTQRWTHIVIHHTATHEGDAFSIDQLHQRRGFWNGLGYHFLINNGTAGKMDGQIQAGPRWIKQTDGAHCNTAGMNEHGIGIVVVGNFSEAYPTRQEIEALVFLTKTLQDYYQIPDRNIVRHNDVPGKVTECPGTRFPWGDFKRRLSRA